MSALAQLLKHEGVQVTGSDREASPITEMLERVGVQVLIPQRAENLPAGTELVVYSDAVPATNPERVRAAELGVRQLSYFEMLGAVSAGKRTVAVAGTHGKTTTTGMLAKILTAAGAAPTAIIGSIVKDFGSNYVPGSSNLFVVEACEYRNHLLELSPEVLVITNLEWDHTDFFPSLEALQETFRAAIAKVPASGAIVTNPALPSIQPLLAGARARIIDYTKEEVPPLKLPGAFNEANARAALAAAKAVYPELDRATAQQALAAFSGTWRRFEYKGMTAKGALIFDDYAHHPTAVRETLQALRARTAGKVYVAFHPHLYSRTRDLLDGFATAFADADEILIAPIYAAREIDDRSISNEILAARIRAEGGTAQAMSMEEIERYLREKPEAGDSVMTMGAGDIYHVADKLIETKKTGSAMMADPVETA